MRYSQITQLDEVSDLRAEATVWFANGYSRQTRTTYEEMSSMLDEACLNSSMGLDGNG